MKVGESSQCLLYLTVSIMATSFSRFRQPLLAGKTTLTSQFIRRASTLPHTIKPSLDEVSAGRLGPRNLEAAVKSLHLDGLVVVSDVIRHAALEHLNAKMVEDAQVLQARGKDGPFNYNVGNIVSTSLERLGVDETECVDSNKTLLRY